MESLSPAVIKGDEEAIQQVEKLIEQVNEENLEYLPSVFECQSSSGTILAGDILHSKGKIVINAFGFRRAGDRMALHDHPGIRGFIKCVRGSMKVRSFTPLSEYSKFESKCQFEGEFICGIDSDVLQLSPTKGNIHEITALEDGTFFFDALYPGYENVDCTYYNEEQLAKSPGDVTLLRKQRIAPSWQRMCSWNFPEIY